MSEKEDIVEGPPTTMRAWAIPLGFQVFGQEIGDHTWVTGDDRYCDGCRFGQEPAPDDFYCGPARWTTGKYVPPPNPPSRELSKGSGVSDTAKCLGGSSYYFMGIPSQSGVVYGINGVCHTLANRILYAANLTVSGAAGYWFIQLIYGTLGTQVPLNLIPPLIWVPWPPFLIGNPLYAVGLAAQLVINIEWSQIRGRCIPAAVGQPVGEESEMDEYLRRVREIHEQPLVYAMQDEWAADSLYGLQEALYRRHMEEVDLTLEYRGRGINPEKLEGLRRLWSDFHKPQRDELDKFFQDQSAINLKSLPAVQLSEHDAYYLANFINTKAAELLQQNIELLGPDDFETFFGHSHDTPFVTIEPDILKGAAIQRGRR